MEAVKENEKNSRTRGYLPAGIKQMIDEILLSKKANVDWKKVLKNFAQNSVKTFLKTSIRKVSKRYDTVPANKLKRKCKMLVAIDTSGSVDISSLEDFFNELHHIYKRGNCEIRVVECDAAIGNIYDFKGKMPTEISGRGGTDFNAPIEYANTVYRPDSIVYFTDGYCSPPSIKTLCPILWMICRNGIDVESFFSQPYPGKAIKMMN